MPSLSISAAELPQFRRRLLAWFQRSKRDLAWRRTRDPYRIWISEVMLQQTRVAAAVPYYLRFCARFPTVRSLARADVETVLRVWAGLGYYSRARNLRLAAREIIARHGGKFPLEMHEALALPGIGRYTASAVLSIAYGEPYAVLDGNVARVLSRLEAMRGDLRRPRNWRALEQTAGLLLAREAPGDWNQAMMELGATLCTPRAPRCTKCPVARWCCARAQGIAGNLPSARKKPRTVRITLAAAVFLDPRGRTLLLQPKDGAPGKGNRGADGAFFSRLWQFPSVTAACNPKTAISRHLESAFGLENVPLAPIATARHAVTFHNLRLAPFLARVERLPKAAGARRPKLAALDLLPISNATRKIAASALAAL